MRGPGPNLTRRRLLRYGAASCGVVAAMISGEYANAAASATAPADAPAEVLIESFSPAGVSLGTARVPKVSKNEAQWRQQLSALSFDVTRRSGTERPFTGVSWNLHADGLYRCI